MMIEISQSRNFILFSVGQFPSLASLSIIRKILMLINPSCIQCRILIVDTLMPTVY